MESEYDEFFGRFEKSIAAEMKVIDENNPNWRKIFMGKVLARWRSWSEWSEIQMDLTEMVTKAVEKNALMWPLARIVIAHDSDGQNPSIVKDYTSEEFLDRQRALKLFKFILSEPELSYILAREEDKFRFSDWYDTEFTWEFTSGEKLTLSRLMVNLTSFCLSSFFERNRDMGFSTFQLYMVTQFRSHSEKVCTSLNPYFGMSAVFKKPEDMNWENPDGFENSGLAISRTFETIDKHFEDFSKRPEIGPLIFELD